MQITSTPNSGETNVSPNKSGTYNTCSWEFPYLGLPAEDRPDDFPDHGKMSITIFALSNF